VSRRGNDENRGHFGVISDPRLGRRDDQPNAALERCFSKNVDTPALINPCLITNDVHQLAAFYAPVLEIEPHTVGEDYVEFRTSTAVRALFAAAAQEKYIPGSATSGQNHSAILEFRVGT
jgi:hypothetical protein